MSSEYYPNIITMVIMRVAITCTLLSFFFQTTVSKKKMYYNMRVKTLQRNKSDLMCRLETEKAALQSNAKKTMQKLYSAVKDVCFLIP